MAYALRYSATLVYIGPGAGPMAGLLAPSLPGNGGGTGQVFEVDGNAAIVPVVAGAGTGNALAAADVTTLTNAMAADIAAQLNAKIAIPQGWISGNP